jgi:hypothetical protein
MNDRAQVRLWENLRLLTPPVAFVLPYPIARLLGGFDAGFQFVDKEVSPVEAFGILATMLLPIAAWAYATMRLEQTLAVLSRAWPTVPGKIDASDVSQKATYRSGRLWALDVRYDPDQPAEAVLETDDRLATQRLFAVWVCLLVVAAGVIVLALRRAFT